MKFVGAKLKNRIEIAVENDWNLRVPANLANAIENASHGRAGGKRALRRQLIHNSVGKRIGKRQSKFEQIGASFFQSKPKINSALQSRIPCADVGDEALAFFLPQTRETVVDPVVHRTR